MFRVMRAFALAVVCAVTAAITVPSGVAGAIPLGFVKIQYRGEPLDFVEGVDDIFNWGVEAEVGSTVLLNGWAEFDDPSFEWEITPSWANGGSFVQAPSVALTCEQEGTISLELYGFHPDNGADYDTAKVFCTRKHITRLELGTPKDPVRTKIRLGTTITFESNPLSPDVPTVWRATGQPTPLETRRFTYTFDRGGNFGVEVSAATASGLMKKWVGYTVVAPPTASVTPSPAGRLQVALGSTVTFDGSGSSSPGGGALTYQWRTSGVSGVAGSAVTFPRRFDRLGNFGVELIVIDELGQRAKQRVEVTVFRPQAPVVSVTPAPANPRGRMTVTLGSTVTFDGRASRDPDGGALTYQWRTSGVRGVAGTASTFSRQFTTVGNYGVELTVIDDEGQQAKRWVGITVAR